MQSSSQSVYRQFIESATKEPPRPRHKSSVRFETINGQRQVFPAGSRSPSSRSECIMMKVPSGFSCSPKPSTMISSSPIVQDKRDYRRLINQNQEIYSHSRVPMATANHYVEFGRQESECTSFQQTECKQCSWPACGHLANSNQNNNNDNTAAYGQHPAHQSAMCQPCYAPLAPNQQWAHQVTATIHHQHRPVQTHTNNLGSHNSRRNDNNNNNNNNNTATYSPVSAHINQVAIDNNMNQLRLHSLLRTDDPAQLRWLKAMRFETELECLTALQARTLAIDENSAGALSIRNSQVTIQELRCESNFILDFIDHLIDSLPLAFNSLHRFSIEFSELWTRLMSQTKAQTARQPQQTTLKSTNYNNLNNNLTIINCTPRKLLASARTLRPLDKLAEQIRALSLEFANLLCEYQEDFATRQSALQSSPFDNDQLEASLRRLKELYGKFVEISIRAECANIVRALDYDFSQSSLNRLSSSSSLRPVRPFESSSSQLPLKWALIALWQLTKDDSYICRTLTEKWQTTSGGGATVGVQQLASSANDENSAARPRVAKRLDYSTKYDQASQAARADMPTDQKSGDLRSEYAKLYQICQNDQEFRRKQQQQQGALSNALEQQQRRPVKHVSTIELLIDIIISQPNKHERLDMMNLIHSQIEDSKLVDIEELDQSVSAAIYTSNQYKVAALRILNHLCVNEQAVKTILRCFSTPPPSANCPVMPENKIIRSVFECYQTAQEHIYQNETVLHNGQLSHRMTANNRPTGEHLVRRPRNDAINTHLQLDDFSDYGSRQTNSLPPSSTNDNGSTVTSTDNDCNNFDQSDDLVVKEAIRLLIQLTTFFHKSSQGHDYYTLIGRFSIESLVKYLTNIIKSTSSREMLLLSLSALANISFITTDPMKMLGTNRIILEMFRCSKLRSKDLELRDQAVTILANTADKNLFDIVDNGGLSFLLSCLESCPTRMANYKHNLGARRENGSAGQEHELYSNGAMLNQEASPRDGECLDYHDVDLDPPRSRYIDNKPRDRKPVDLSEELLDDLDCACDQQQDSLVGGQQSNVSLCLTRLKPAELAAMERIHQKTAVAFARMSVDPSTSRMILKLGGVKQMIDLCKLSHRRNFSDTVLIACIAALRKMSKVIESEVFRHYNALDLIELDLNHTLEIYGHPKKFSNVHMGMFTSDL